MSGPNGPTVYESQEAKIAAGELGAQDKVSITMARSEWVNLLRALREEPKLQPQLGRLAWMSVTEIEVALLGI